jgi:predicted Zn-dependent protease
MVMTDRRPLALALALLLLAAGSFQPATAQTVSNPDLYDKSLQVAAEVAAHYGTWEDPEQLARVNRTSATGWPGARATEASPSPSGVVDMPEPNAFALPGGQIFVTRGMLELGLDDDMLANVLGHEIAHVTRRALPRRCSARRHADERPGQALLVGVMIARVAGNGRRNRPEAPYDPAVRDRRTDVVQGAAAASLVISELLLRSYSRDHEDQADQEGQRWPPAAGFDPDGAAACSS